MADSAEELDDISLEDSLEAMKRDATAVEVHLLESIKQLKHFQKRVAQESKTIEVPLQPKTRMMKWLTDRGLNVESTFQEFFEVFVEEHTKDHRLDVSARTIQLNRPACILFGMKEPKPVLHLYEILEKTQALYY
jgi:hypothetical protein